MRTATRRSLVATGALVVALTLWRLVALTFDTTDLWVDEAQYWLWGQRLDWGYFSKPPMIAWVSRAVTDLAGSDAIFWIRMPGAILHALTAVLVGFVAAEWADGRTRDTHRTERVEAGCLAALLYLTAPFASLGSWQFSTDTILLPFYAAAVLAWSRLTRHRSLGWTVVLGVTFGMGLLSKYAMIYLGIGIGLAAVLVPSTRIARRDAVLATLVAVVVFSPNLIWNALNGAQTLEHTASDNARLGAGTWSVTRGLEFLAAQFAVVGPVLFVAWAVGVGRALTGRATSTRRALAWLSLPAVVLMTVQATRAQAHANWAVTAYVAGIALAAFVLIDRPGWRRTTLAINGTIAIVFPLLFIFGDSLRLPDGRLLAARYVGAAAFSEAVGETARRAELRTIVAAERWLLADLFHTLRGYDLLIRSVPPDGKVSNFYQADYPLSVFEGRALYIEDRVPPPCAGEVLDTIAPLDGVRAGRTFTLHALDAACFAR